MAAQHPNPPAPTPKRLVRQLAVHEKLEAIQRVHEGESKASVARIIGVPESTLRGWCKNEDKLLAMASMRSPSPDGGPSEPAKRFKADDSLLFWVRNQQQERPLAPTGFLPEQAGWFWRWYKHYGYGTVDDSEPLPLVKPKTALDNVLLNLDNNNLSEEAKENARRAGSASGQGSDAEDDPPETAAEAVRHGERFLRWLECCSDPSVTAVQLLQFRYLLNNVRSCAERRANKFKTPAPRPRRK